MPGWKISNMCVLRVCAEAGEEGEASNFSRDLVVDLASNYRSSAQWISFILSSIGD